jgi:hypothetical protein
MLLQILWALETLATEVAFVWLERDVDTNMGRDMITLYSGSAAKIPPAGEVQVVRGLAANMAFANVLLVNNKYQLSMVKTVQC